MQTLFAKRPRNSSFPRLRIGRPPPDRETPARERNAIRAYVNRVDFAELLQVETFEHNNPRSRSGIFMPRPCVENAAAPTFENAKDGARSVI